jgi:protein-L-isoaspartate(D-aspartate) O-methyltransferase
MDGNIGPNRFSSRSDYASRREAMVREQLMARGLRDERVLWAMRVVRRHAFVPEKLREFAYEDSPLTLGRGQTISQPYVVALMAQALELSATDRVLEIGAGSGYAAAVLGVLAARVDTLERLPELAERAARILAAEGFENVHLHQRDGTLGLPELAPFDAIVVTAGGPDVPPALLEQLAPGGRLVIPVGELLDAQRLQRLTRAPDGTVAREDLGPVRFVPLIGAQGWHDADAARRGERSADQTEAAPSPIRRSAKHGRP